MDSESSLFNDTVAEAASTPQEQWALIMAGRIFSYYRIIHDGKFFFFKTFTDDTPLARKLLRREYELSVSLDSPYILHTFLYGEFLPGKEGILMEYIDGRPLSSFMAEIPSAELRRRVFSQLLDAVEYLHTKGIIHNDLKPDNLLISRSGNNLKLIDFDLSDDDGHFLLKTPGCSADFAAPELREERNSDARSDIYSIGKLTGLLFGRRYRRLRRKCVRRSPEKRFTSVAHLRRAWKRRHRPLQFGAALLGALLIGTAAWLYIDEKAEQRGRLQHVEGELATQRQLNEKQTEEFQRLQTSYDDVNGQYQTMKEGYQYMQDSIEQTRQAALAHRQAVNAAVDGFRFGLNKRMQTTYDSLKRCSTWQEMSPIRQRYVEAVRKYHASYPKMVDGEDISSLLSALLLSSLEKSDELFNAEIHRLH